jgi:Flp pilus assembly protein TadB
VKGHLAATLSTARITFGAAVDAATAAAGRRVNLIELSSARIINREHGDAEEAILLHSSEFLSARSDRGKLVAAAFAGAERAGAGAINGKHLRVCVQLPMKIRH